MKRFKWSSLYLIIIAAVLLEMISVVRYYYTYKIMADEFEKRAELEITMKCIIAKNMLNMTENSLEGHVWDLMRNLSSPDSMYGVAEWVLRSHPNLMGCGIAFVPNYYPEKGRWYEPYVFRGKGQSVFHRMQAGGPDHDYTTMAFYQEPIKRQASFWTYPYYSLKTNQKIVTYCRPIHNDANKTVAVFGLDVALDWMGDTLNYRHMYPSSFDLLLTESGQLIAGPQIDDPQKKKQVDNIVRMINDSTVVKRFSGSGRSRVFDIKDPKAGKGSVFFASFKGHPKWQLAVVCYDREVYAKLWKMGLNMGVLMLLGLLVLAFIVIRFVRNNRRLQQADREQARIGSELRIANDIQMQMLPKSFDLGRDGIEIFGSLTPAREVGGDLFDFFLRDEKLFFCIGDVSGKGVPSAMVMAVIHSLFRMASAHENNPARIMQSINEASCQGNESNMFVTLFLGILDLPTGRLRYCCAGHDRPVVMVNGQLSIINCNPNLPVGLMDDLKYEMDETTIEAHSTLFLYTDGLTEAKDRERRQFGLERVKSVLERSGGDSPEELVERMKQEVVTFCRGAEQSDDLTLMAIRYDKTRHQLVLEEKLMLQSDVRQVKDLNAFVVQVMERLQIKPDMMKKVKLAVEEAVVNVMDYAYPTDKSGDIGIEATADGQWLRFVITDSGVAFDPTEKEKADTTLSAEDRPIGGMGILLVRELMDSINYERADGKNVLTLSKRYN